MIAPWRVGRWIPQRPPAVRPETHIAGGLSRETLDTRRVLCLYSGDRTNQWSPTRQENTMNTTQRLSRSAAKVKVREIRASAARLANLLDTTARNPEWAAGQEAQIRWNLTELLNEIDGTSAQLREGLGLEGS